MVRVCGGDAQEIENALREVKAGEELMTNWPLLVLCSDGKQYDLKKIRCKEI